MQSRTIGRPRPAPLAMAFLALLACGTSSDKDVGTGSIGSGLDETGPGPGPGPGPSESDTSGVSMGPGNGDDADPPGSTSGVITSAGDSETPTTVTPTTMDPETTGSSMGTGGPDDWDPFGDFVENQGADCELSGEMPTSYNSSTLPDPFLKLDGTRMSTRDEWRCRRQEIQRMVESFVHSQKPPPPESVSGTVSDTSITVNVTDQGNSVSFSVSVSMPPNAQRPVPAIIGAGASNLDGSILSSEGVATITYNHQQMASETSRAGTFSQLYGTDHSSVVAWAWGVSRIIDVLEQNPGTIDATRIGVTGCSRNGKAAFGIGAFDQRIALSIPMEAGTGGIGSYRMANSNIPGDNDGQQPQSLSSAWSEAQGWFGPVFQTYINNPDDLPVDAHFMGAMYAPRGLLILDNPYIGHLCPMCGHVGAQATAEVYEALGYGENIYYFSASGNGTHCSFQAESADMLRSAIRAFLTRTEEPAGEFRVGDWATNAAGSLSEWADWEAPTLQ